MLEQLKQCKLFHNISTDGIRTILSNNNFNIKNYNKNNIIVQQHDSLQSLGIILKGTVQIIREDVDGQISIIDHLYTNDFIGCAIVFSDNNVSPITVHSIDDVEILYLSIDNTICNYNSTFLYNIINFLSNQNQHLTYKIDILSKRTVRDKFLTYLQYETNRVNSRTITLNNKSTVADFLCVDRTALFRTIKKLEEDKIISVTGKKVTLL